MRKGLLKEHHKTIELCKKTLDFMLIAGSGIFSYWTSTGQYIFQTKNWEYILLGGLLSIVSFHFFKLYKAWRGIDIISEVIAVFNAWLLPCITLFIINILKIGAFSEQWLLSWFISCLILLVLYRLCLKLLLNYFRTIGFNQRSICIITYGTCAEKLFKSIHEKKFYGFNIHAVFANGIKDNSEIYGNQLKGKIKKTYSWLLENEVEQIWIVLPLEKVKILKEVMNNLQHSTADIRFFPDINSFNLINHSISVINNSPCFNMSISPIDNTILKLVKRFEDIVIGVTVFILLLPIMFFISIIIKVTSGSPVFFTQERVGLNNKIFKIYKFRTMPVDIEKCTGAIWAKSGENRATKFGGFLRKTSLDELPQLFNVIKGEMSLVGPRPERPELIDKFKNEIPLYMKKHMVKAGMTGWAQVNGWRGNTDLKKRIEYDIYYIENFSLSFDLKIIILTIIRGFINKNAY